MSKDILVTMTLNPCIDKTVTLDEFCIGGLNRITSARYDLSGKGINLSSAYRALGGRTNASGILFTGDEKAYKAKLENEDIAYDFVEVAGKTRENLKVRDTKSGEITEINEPGQTIEPVVIERLKQKVSDISRAAQIVAFSGSIPPGCPQNIYQQLLMIAKKNGAKTVLDCDGVMLELGLQSAPDLIKPNLFELCQISGKNLTTKADIIEATRSLTTTYGVSYAAVTMGADGAILVTAEKAYIAEPLKLTVQSATGAGDTFVAGFLTALVRGLEEPDLLRWAMAAAGDSVTRAGTQVCTLKGTEQLLDKVMIEEF